MKFKLVSAFRSGKRHSEPVEPLMDASSLGAGLSMLDQFPDLYHDLKALRRLRDLQKISINDYEEIKAELLNGI